MAMLQHAGGRWLTNGPVYSMAGASDDFRCNAYTCILYLRCDNAVLVFLCTGLPITNDNTCLQLMEEYPAAGLFDIKPQIR